MNLNRAILIVALSCLFMGGKCYPPAKDYCKAMCDCELCADKTYDECLLNETSSYEIANAYDCGEQYEAFDNCVLPLYECDAGTYILDWDSAQSAAEECSNLWDDYMTCVDAASGYGD